MQSRSLGGCCTRLSAHSMRDSSRPTPARCTRRPCTAPSTLCASCVRQHAGWCFDLPGGDALVSPFFLAFRYTPRNDDWSWRPRRKWQCHCEWLIGECVPLSRLRSCTVLRSSALTEALHCFSQLLLAKRLSLFLHARHESLFRATYVPAAEDYAGFSLLQSGGGVLNGTQSRAPRDGC